MKLTDSVYLVGSGDAGFSLTHPGDCGVFLVDGGGPCALIDAGIGLEPERILSQIHADGFDPEQISHILLTHGHGDHAGGAAALARACGARVFAMEPAAGFIREGNTEALSIDAAMQAGVFEPAFAFETCPVEPLTDGQQIAVGRSVLTAIRSEGHCAGHCCFLMEEGGKRVLFAGDAVQCGGKIALQAIWDCDLQAYLATVRRLCALGADVLLPAHGCVALSRGNAHLKRAVERLDTLALPRNAIGE